MSKHAGRNERSQPTPVFALVINGESGTAINQMKLFRSLRAFETWCAHTLRQRWKHDIGLLVKARGLPEIKNIMDDAGVLGREPGDIPYAIMSGFYERHIPHFVIRSRVMPFEEPPQAPVAGQLEFFETPPAEPAMQLEATPG